MPAEAGRARAGVFADAAAAVQARFAADRIVDQVRRGHHHPVLGAVRVTVLALVEQRRASVPVVVLVLHLEPVVGVGGECPRGASGPAHRPEAVG